MQHDKPLDLTPGGLTAKIKTAPDSFGSTEAEKIVQRLLLTRQTIIQRLFSMAEENGGLKNVVIEEIRAAKGESFDPKDLTVEEIQRVQGVQIENFMRQRDLHKEAIPLMHKLDVIDAVLHLNDAPGVQEQTIGQGIPG